MRAFLNIERHIKIKTSLITCALIFLSLIPPALDELIKRPERSAACYGVQGSETDEPVEDLRKP